MSPKKNGRVVTIYAVAWTGAAAAWHRCQVDDTDGTVRVYDPVARHYTRCHCLSEAVSARVRALATQTDLDLDALGDLGPLTVLPPYEEGVDYAS